MLSNKNFTISFKFFGKQSAAHIGLLLNMEDKIGNAIHLLWELHSAV